MSVNGTPTSATPNYRSVFEEGFLGQVTQTWGEPTGYPCVACHALQSNGRACVYAVSARAEWILAHRVLYCKAHLPPTLQERQVEPACGRAELEGGTSTQYTSAFGRLRSARTARRCVRAQDGGEARGSGRAETSTQNLRLDIS